jgi:hypothetical protein
MAGNRSKKLPSFKSVKELVAFFDSHDMGDYWEGMPEAKFEVNLKRKGIAGNSKIRSSQMPTKSTSRLLKK